MNTRWILALLPACLAAAGCTVKAVGDPNRPITINAHVTIDIKGLQNTATNIEDFVAGEATEESIVQPKGETQ